MAVIVVERRNDGFTPSWGARCPDCRAWLSKWDHSADEARACGEAELSRHVCGTTVATRGTHAPTRQTETLF